VIRFRFFMGFLGSSRRARWRLGGRDQPEVTFCIRPRLAEPRVSILLSSMVIVRTLTSDIVVLG